MYHYMYQCTIYAFHNHNACIIIQAKMNCSCGSNSECGCKGEFLSHKRENRYGTHEQDKQDDEGIEFPNWPHCYGQAAGKDKIQ